MTGSQTNSPKFHLMFNLLDQSLLAGDKTVVFTQSSQTLDLLEELLGGKVFRGQQWLRNTHYFRIDGRGDPIAQAKVCKRFNSQSDSVGLCLFLTRANGIKPDASLIGANRVIVLDALWNSNYDLQALSRVHRCGQKKEVFVYRLVADGTMERRVFTRQVPKSLLVSSSTTTNTAADKQQKRLHRLNELAELFTHSEREPVGAELLASCLAAQNEPVLRACLAACPDFLAEAPQEQAYFFVENMGLALNNKQKEEAEKEYSDAFCQPGIASGGGGGGAPKQEHATQPPPKNIQRNDKKDSATLKQQYQLVPGRPVGSKPKKAKLSSDRPKEKAGQDWAQQLSRSMYANANANCKIVHPVSKWCQKI